MATISGMFGAGKVFFAESPVVIEVTGLTWPTKDGKPTSPFNLVYVRVKDGNGKVIGEFRAETGGQSSIRFDISSALMAWWAGHDFSAEAAKANPDAQSPLATRSHKGYYYITAWTEYMNTEAGGELVFVRTEETNPPATGGSCCIGWMTEREREATADGSESALSLPANKRNGKASTKPTSTPERVGASSITSWVGIDGSNTTSHFYKATAETAADSDSDHAPIVLRDSEEYTDFLFVNRRGAIETCSGRMKESMGITVETQHYARIERPSFRPSRSLMAIPSGGRRSWQMSSGYQTREWADWWIEEFLMARQWWMLYGGEYVPVIVEPAKKQPDVYDRAKQGYAHVDFTVTMALEG